jgi:WD40 repeat protein
MSNLRSVAFSPDGRLALSGGHEGVQSWDVETGTELSRFVCPPLHCVAFAPDGERAAAADTSGNVTVFRVEGGRLKEPLTLPTHGGVTNWVSFSPDGTRLASAGQDGRVVLRDAFSAAQVGEWQLPGRVESVCFAQDGRHFASANYNGTVYIFRTAAEGR